MQVAVKVFGTSTSTHSQQHTQPGPASESQLQLPQPQQQKPQQVSRAFLREVEVLHLVSEDALYCARMYGCTFKEGQPCIVMKWFPNGHLRVPPGEAPGWLGPSRGLPAAFAKGQTARRGTCRVDAGGAAIASSRSSSLAVLAAPAPHIVWFEVPQTPPPACLPHQAAALALGHSPSTCVHAGGYSLPSALQWGTSIAKALAEVHALGIVVADLKPENVLVTEQQDAVLADFGISKRVAGTTGLLAACTSDGSTAAGGVRGTPCYM